MFKTYTAANRGIMESREDCVYGTVLCIHYMIPFSNKGINAVTQPVKQSMLHLRLLWSWPLSEDQSPPSSVALQWPQMMVVGGDQRSCKMARTEKVNKNITLHIGLIR